MKFSKINHLSTRLFLIILGAILPFLILLIYNAEVERENAIAEAVKISLRLAQTVGSVPLSTILEPDWFSKTYASISHDYPGVDLLVFDSTGAVLAYLPDNNQELAMAKVVLEQANGKSFVSRSTGADGKAHIFGVIPLSNTIGGQQSYVAVGIPLAEFEIVGNQLFLRDLILGGLALIASLVTFRFVSKWLVIRLLQPIILAARRLRDGDLTARVHAPPDDTDLGSLAQTFDEMADTIEQRSKELEMSYEKYRQLFMQSPIGLYRASPDGTILDANKSLIGMLGLNQEGTKEPYKIGQFIVDPIETERWKQVIASQKGLADYELRLRKASGEMIYALDNARAITSPDGTILYYEGSLQDITERKLNEALMKELAFHDPLTGLLNRNAFEEEMQRLQARVTRNGHRFAIFFIDLDHFKHINDQYNHDTGDAILKEVTTRIQAVIRTEDIFSRFGGDEFILLVEIIEVEEARLIAERILNIFKEPVKFNQETIQISLSIGIGIYPDDSDDPEELIRDADHAMYENKRKRKRQIQVQITGPHSPAAGADSGRRIPD